MGGIPSNPNKFMKDSLMVDCRTPWFEQNIVKTFSVDIAEKNEGVLFGRSFLYASLKE